jgi:hypothetical protein
VINPPVAFQDAFASPPAASQSLLPVLRFLRFFRHSLAETPWKVLKARAEVEDVRRLAHPALEDVVEVVGREAGR